MGMTFSGIPPPRFRKGAKRRGTRAVFLHKNRKPYPKKPWVGHAPGLSTVGRMRPRGQRKGIVDSAYRFSLRLNAAADPMIPVLKQGDARWAQEWEW